MIMQPLQVKNLFGRPMVLYTIQRPVYIQVPLQLQGYKGEWIDLKTPYKIKVSSVSI